MRIQRSLKDVKLAQESGSDGQAKQREHEERKDCRDRRLALAKTRVVIERKVFLARSAKLRNDRESADRYQCIAKEIEQHSGVRSTRTNICIGGQLGNGGKRDKNIAGVCNRAVSQHALDAALKQSAEIAYIPGGHGENPEGPEPEMCGRRNADEYPKQLSESRSLWSGGEERGNRSRRAFVNVWRPKLEGRGGHFEAEADEDQGQAELQYGAGRIGGIHTQEIGGASDAVDERDAI